MGTKPLDGVLVVALEQAVAAPITSGRLAAAGARVIKVERPEGDFARDYDVAAGGVSSYFAWANAGKESIALDLRKEADVAVMWAMLEQADVFIQNLAVGAIDRLGFGADALHERNPRLIICDLSGYGPDGPYATMKAYDLLVQAESGVISISGAPPELGRIGVSMVDATTGLNATIGVLEALHRQQRTGEGAHITTSLFESMANLMTVPLLHHDYLDNAPTQAGLAHPSVAPYGAFESADGQRVLISIQSDREWRDLCGGVLDQPDLGTDERFATNIDRVANRTETDQVVQDGFDHLPWSELEDRLRATRIAYGLINDVAGVSVHPQMRRVTLEHEHGLVAVPAPPVRNDWLDLSEPARLPALDEHGAALRAEFAPQASD